MKPGEIMWIKYILFYKTILQNTNLHETEWRDESHPLSDFIHVLNLSFTKSGSSPTLKQTEDVKCLKLQRLVSNGSAVTEMKTETRGSVDTTHSECTDAASAEQTLLWAC